MESAATTLPANLFPTATSGAPDLDDVAAHTMSNPTLAFPTAPGARTFQAPEMRDTAPKPGTKVDRAVAYLRANGTGTIEQLSEFLDIKRESVSAYLQVALKDGRIARENGVFTLGDGKPALPTPTPAPKAKSPPPTPAARATKVAGNDAKVAASLCVGDLQLIEWATGNLTIRANDNVVDLDALQADALRMFIKLAR